MFATCRITLQTESRAVWLAVDCVSNLVVCDGHEDCYNGWDESEQVCSRT